MNVERIIQAIPKMDKATRRTVRDRALAWVAEGPTDRATDGKAVLEALDSAEATEREQLAHHVENLDRAQRIVEAFTKQPLTEHERHVVQILLDNPGLSSKALTREAGWRGKAWHMHFGGLCKVRGHLLWPATYQESWGADFFSGILADFDNETKGFTMKPEAVEGFHRIGLKSTRLTTSDPAREKDQ